MTNNQSYNFNSAGLFLFIYRWKKLLILIGVIAMIASIVFSSSFFITPKYKSTVIMFPTSTNSVSKALMADNYGATQDILQFGAEEQSEQLLQILNSNKIRARIIEKYNLLEHYNISSNSKFKNTILFKKYENNIRFRRTEFMAVEIEVLDKDPQMAADIANDIAALLDSTKNTMQRERAIQGLKIVEAEYLKLKNEILKMEDSLKELRKLGINDYETQAEAYNTQHAIALSHNNASGAKAIEEKLKILSEYGSSYVSIRDALEFDKKQLSVLRTKYEEAKVDAEQELPGKFVVNSAFKAEQKSYPIRWLIILVFTLLSMLIGVVTNIVFDYLNRRKNTYS